MSDSLDVDEVNALLKNMGNIAKRCDTMGAALGGAWRGVDLPSGCDLSGLVTALRCLQGIRSATATQGKALYDTVTQANEADKSWGDHVKGWLTPPKTGVHLLDGVLSTPASAAAGVTDAGYDLGAGAVGLAWDIIDIPGDVSAYQHGDPMPIQKPGLGFINIALNPGDAVKAAGGWKYHDDPTRMGTYAIANLAAIIATGGGGELAEGALASRLARLTEEGSTTSRTLTESIEDLEQRRADMPSSRQRSPGKGDRIRRRKASMDKDIQDLRDQLKAHEDHMAKVTDRYTWLKRLRGNEWVKGVGALTSLNVPYVAVRIAHWIDGVDGAAETFASRVWSDVFEAQGYASGGYDYTKEREARQRLAQFQADRPGRQMWLTP